MALFNTPSPARLRVPTVQPGRLALVRRLLGENTSAALAYAMVESRWDVASRIIEDGGVGVDEPNPDGQTPVVWAILSKQIEGVRVFVSLGCDMRQRWRGEPLLHLAAMVGDGQIAGYLLQQGADPDELDARGFTALHIAAMRGSRVLANVLLGHGADPHILTAPPEPNDEKPDAPRVNGTADGVSGASDPPPPAAEAERRVEAMRRDVAGKTAMEIFNDATMHPLEYAQVCGVTLDHKSLFHWFVGLSTAEPDPDPLPDSVMESAPAPPADRRDREVRVPPMHRYRASREEVTRELAAATVGGIEVPGALLNRKLLAHVGDAAWVTYYQFSSVVLGCVAAL